MDNVPVLTANAIRDWCRFDRPSGGPLSCADSAPEEAPTMTDLAEPQNYVTPPIDQDVERISTEFLQSGGGFLSVGPDPQPDMGGRLASLRPTAQTVDEQARSDEAEPMEISDAGIIPDMPAAAPPVASSGSAPATDPRPPAKSSGIIRRLMSRSARRTQLRGSNGRQL